MFYEKPKMDMILFHRLDVIRTSGEDPDLGDDEGEGKTDF